MKYRVRELTNGKFRAEKKFLFFPWRSCWFVRTGRAWDEKNFTSKKHAEDGIEKYVKEKKYEKSPNIFPYTP